MDNDKLIEDFKQLEFVAYNYNINGEVFGMDCTDFENIMADAATALSTLQIENEKLRAELNDLKAKCDKYQPREHWETLNEALDNLRAGLARVTAERDAAVEELRGKCSVCLHYTPYHNDGPCASCKFEIACFVPEKATDKWEWRGMRKD